MKASKKLLSLLLVVMLLVSAIPFQVFAALAGFGRGDRRQSGAFFPGGYKM